MGILDGWLRSQAVQAQQTEPSFYDVLGHLDQPAQTLAQQPIMLAAGDQRTLGGAPGQVGTTAADIRMGTEVWDKAGAANKAGAAPQRAQPVQGSNLGAVQRAYSGVNQARPDVMEPIIPLGDFFNRR